MRMHGKLLRMFITATLVTSCAVLILSWCSQAARADTSPESSQAAIELRNDMRQLWEEHVIWTRQVIVSVAAGLPDLKPAIDRLMQNQVDIGNAVRPYYGDPGADKLTSLLKEHIAIAGELLTAAKAGDKTKTEDAKTRWYKNADDIAAFLSGANPQNWPEDAVKSLMKMHLDTTMDEAVARLSSNWAADIAAFDKVQKHILVMADALSLGIIRQFPAKFAGGDSPSIIGVDILDSKYQPREIEVPAGTAIKWTSNGYNPHTVTADSANAAKGGPDSSSLFPQGIRMGQSYSWTVPASAAKGTKWYYHCMFHGAEGDGHSMGIGMSGSITAR